MNDSPRVPSSTEVRDLVGERPRHRSLRLLAWAVVAIVGAALIVFLWQEMAGRGASRVEFVTAPVTRGGLTVTVTATGSVQPTNKVEISSELSGTVRRKGRAA